MDMNFGLLTFVIASAAVIWFWRDALRARDVANHAAMEACERLGLQFLDGTAAFGAWRWRRDAGRLRLRRVYVFDYTAQSIERRQGFVVLMAGRVESIGFAQDGNAKPVVVSAPVVTVTMTYGPQKSRLEWKPKSKDTEQKETEQIDSGRSESSSPDPTPPDSNSNHSMSGKVLDLAEWRRNRRPGERLH